MSGNRIQIGELRLCALPLTAEQARRLGQALAVYLSQMPLSFAGARRISGLTVRFNPRSLTSIERMAEEIATMIQRGLD